MPQSSTKSELATAKSKRTRGQFLKKLSSRLSLPRLNKRKKKSANETIHKHSSHKRTFNQVHIVQDESNDVPSALLSVVSSSSIQSLPLSKKDDVNGKCIQEVSDEEPEDMSTGNINDQDSECCKLEVEASVFISSEDVGNNFDEDTEQVSKDICDGKLGWRSNEVPGGTSMLLVQRDNLDHRMGNAETLRIIDLKSKNVGLDNETFEKLTKTSIILPKTVTELIENVATICKVFHIFSDDCFVARKLDDLVSKLRMNQSTIQSYCNKNEDGVTLILAAFDRKLKNFIDQVGLFPENLGHICSQLNFDKIISNLEDGTFHFTDVPSCIKGLKERCNKRRKFDDDEESIEQSLSETE